MDDGTWERWGALGGIVFVVLVSASAFLPGSPPMTDDPPSEIVRFVVDKGDEIRWAGYLGALAMIPFFWFLASLWRLLRRGEGGTPRLTVMATLGGAFAAILGALGGILLAVIPIIGVKELGPGATRAFFILAANVGLLPLFGIAALTFGASVVFIRSRVMPAWLGYLGLLTALVALAGGYATVSTREEVFTVAFVGFLLATLWILLVSIFMLRKAPEPVVAAA